MQINPVGLHETEITQGNKLVLFSYKTPVAFIRNSVGYRTSQNWSKTTSRHINKFFARHPVVSITTIGQDLLDSF